MNIFDSSIPHLAKNIQLAINSEGESESKFPFFGDFVFYPPIRKQIILLLRQFIVLGRKLVLRPDRAWIRLAGGLSTLQFLERFFVNKSGMD